METEFAPGMSELGKRILAEKRQRAAYSRAGQLTLVNVSTAIINALARKAS